MHSHRRVFGSQQILLNGSRLGFYESIRTNVNRLLGFSPKQQIMPTSVLAGAMSGVIGGE